jgi:hypothetical protein
VEAFVVRGAVLSLLAASCSGCSFEVTFSVAMDLDYGTLEFEGRPTTYVTIERSFGSIDEAQSTEIAFEVTDGAGRHTFDLSQYVFCDYDTDPADLDVSLLLTYEVTCMPEPFDPDGPLRLCWTGSLCNGSPMLP